VQEKYAVGFFLLASIHLCAGASQTFKLRPDAVNPPSDSLLACVRQCDRVTKATWEPGELGREVKTGDALSAQTDCGDPTEFAVEFFMLQVPF